MNCRSGSAGAAAARLRQDQVVRRFLKIRLRGKRSAIRRDGAVERADSLQRFAERVLDLGIARRQARGFPQQRERPGIVGLLLQIDGAFSRPVAKTGVPVRHSDNTNAVDLRPDMTAIALVTPIQSAYRSAPGMTMKMTTQSGRVTEAGSGGESAMVAPPRAPAATVVPAGAARGVDITIQ